MDTNQAHPTRKFTARHLMELLGIGIVILLVFLLLPQAGQSRTQSGAAGYYPPLTPPKPPTHLRADPGVDNIELTWYPSPSPGLKGYWVYRGTDASDYDSFALAYPRPIRGDRWVDPPRGVTNTLEPDVDYYYYLWAEDVKGQKSPEFSNVSNSKLRPDEQPQPGDPPPAPAHRGELRLFIPDSGAVHGATITVPIKIGNADGLVIDSMDVWVKYNPGVITATQIVKTTLLRDYPMDSNIITADDGEGVAAAVIFANFGGPPRPVLYGEATLFEMTFQVPGAPGQVSPMYFPVSFTLGGMLRVTDIYTDVLLPEIPLILQGGTFTVTVGESFLMGDVEPAGPGDNDVDQADAQMAMSIAVANVLPNYRQKQVGDMNGDERINSADAALIMRQAGRLSRVLSSSYGRFMRTLMTASPTNPVTVTVATKTSRPGANVTVPIRVTNAGQAAGIDLMLNYNPQALILNSITAGELVATNFELDYTQGSTQTVKVSLGPKTAGAAIGGTGTGKLVYVNFTIRRDAPGGWSPFTLVSARLSDGFGRDFASSDLQTPVILQSGVIGIFPVYLPITLKNFL